MLELLPLKGPGLGASKEKGAREENFNLSLKTCGFACIFGMNNTIF